VSAAEEEARTRAAGDMLHGGSDGGGASDGRGAAEFELRGGGEGGDGGDGGDDGGGDGGDDGGGGGGSRGRGAADEQCGRTWTKIIGDP
jgi:hypothetical protein